MTSRADRSRWLFVLHPHRAFYAYSLTAADIDRFDRLVAGAKRPRQRRTAMYWLLRRSFPWGPMFWFTGDPVRAILAGDEALQDRAFREIADRAARRPQITLQLLFAVRKTNV